MLGVIYYDTPDYWPQALVAAFAFCLIASAVYIYNDLQDLDEDRLHPQKSLRPLASAKVSIEFALSACAFLLVSGLGISLAISNKLTLILGIYLVINIMYNYWLRKVPIADVLCIASGFMLRTLAGTIGIGLPFAWWLTLTVTWFTLFIALNKRRLEMQLQRHTIRAALSKYNPRLLDILIIGTAITCFFTYLFYILYEQEESFYFILTLPFTAFGLWRFIWLTTRKSSHDDPVALFFSDILSRINLVCFFGLTLMAIAQ